MVHLKENNNRRAGIRLESYKGTAGAWDIVSGDNSAGAAMSFQSVESGTTGMLMQSNGFIGVGTVNPSERLHVDGGIHISGGGRLTLGREVVSHHDVVNGSSIAVARGSVAYLVIVSSNYSTEASVRGSVYMVLLDYEGDAVVAQEELFNYNNQGATFSVSDGNLIISDLPAGNPHVAVFTN